MTNTATFSNGHTISRESDKAYSFAWMAVNVQPKTTQVAHGFSSTEQGAIRAARSVFSGFAGSTKTEIVRT